MKYLQTVLAALLAVAVSAGSSFAADFKFTIHHFLSAKAPAQTKLIEPWAKKVEADSKGRIKFEIFPSMSMGGKPPALYQQVRDGVADLVWTVPGYTPGVFPRLEVFELPEVHQGSAKATTLAIQDMMDKIKDDFKDIKPILVHVHTGNILHLRKKAVKSLADVKGLKIRTPSRTGSWMLSSWGAEPVGMPVPTLPQAMSKGIVDGALIPFEVAIPLKLAELADNSVDLSSKKRFGTLVFIFGMNKKSYNSLPADLKKVIDDNSGVAIAGTVGEAWDSIEPIGIKKTLDKGKKVYDLSADESSKFDELHKSVTKKWIAEVKAKGINGEELVAAAKAAIAKHSK